MNYLVTAIGTDSGKTIVSAILTEALKADYWKPVQCGMPRDLETVRSLVTNEASQFHSETYLLKTPASPHAAARIDEVKVEAGDLIPPSTPRDLIIEGAGGAMVPLNDHEMMIDLAWQFDAEVVLVADLYLGSINHTLLTVEALQRRECRVKGIIFNMAGQNDLEWESERIILQRSGYRKLLSVRKELYIDKEVVKRYAMKLLIR